MKTIIALRGKSNSGKTSTFLILADSMIKTGFIEDVGNFQERKNRKIGRDFWQIFKKGKTTIGVVSAGDVGEGVKQFLEDLDKGHGCSIILCTCRSFGETVKAINEKVGFVAKFEEKKRELDKNKQQVADTEAAERVLETLNKLLLSTSDPILS
jgi:nucleoside-diphosphate-sugar epimerase